MSISKADLLLYAVTEDATESDRRIASVQAAVNGGVTCVQLRDKSLHSASLLAEALKLKAICQAAGVPFIVNDDVQLALACRADGVHVGQSDMPAAEVRRLVGPDMAVGVSVATVEQATAAQAAGADYLGAGAVFATATKGDAAIVSLETLKAICAAVQIPVVAIGGITAGNMPLLAASGVAGVALVSAVFSQDEITTACRALRKQAEELFRRLAPTAAPACR